MFTLICFARNINRDQYGIADDSKIFCMKSILFSWFSTEKRQTQNGKTTLNGVRLLGRTLFARFSGYWRTFGRVQQGMSFLYVQRKHHDEVITPNNRVSNQ